MFLLPFRNPASPHCPFVSLSFLQVTEEGRQVEGVYVHYRPRRMLHVSSPSDVIPMVDSLSSSVISHDVYSGHRQVRGNHPHLHPHLGNDTTFSRDHPNSGGGQPGGGSSTTPWSTVTVMNAFASSYVLSRLSANTEYEVFLAPFSDTETGQPTALLTNVTFEAGEPGVWQRLNEE